MSQHNTRSSKGTSFEIYLFNFDEIFRSLGRDQDVFYFYPDEVKGFIESCVLATQREIALGSRKNNIYEDITAARKLWGRKVQEAAWRDQFSINGHDGIEDFEIDQAFYLGCIVDKQTASIVDLLKYAHGEYSIAARSFRWTGINTLSMRVGF